MGPLDNCRPKKLREANDVGTVPVVYPDRSTPEERQAFYEKLVGLR